MDLPTPLFVNDADGLSPSAVLNDMIAAYEAATGRTLYPAQVEQLLINLYGSREILLRNAIQYCGMQNLLAFAAFPMLDYLGQLFATPRLPPQPAVSNVLITLTAAQGTPTVIAAGYQVGTADGIFVFATVEDLVIPAGGLTGTVGISCTSPGAAGNGYIAGQINQPLTVNGLVSTAVNTTTSDDGADEETDDHYRVRIQAAPNTLTTAGPAGQYRAIALGVSQTIVDVQVVTPAPGTVQLFVLCGPATQPAASPNPSGLPSADLLTAIQDACSADTVRPLCDTVIVSAVTEVDYIVTATITLYANVNYAAVYAGIVAAAQQLALRLAAAVGQDVVLSQWETALSVAGVYDATVALAASIGGVPVAPNPEGNISLNNGQWANATAINLTVVLGSKNQPTS